MADTPRPSRRTPRSTRRPPSASMNGASPVEQLVANKELFVMFQPVVDLRNGKVFAYEALVRSTSPSFPSPATILASALEHRVCGKLGRAIRELASSGCPDATLFLNIHPSELDEGWLVRPDDPMFSHEHPVYLEITESVPLTHFRFCHGVLSEVRSRGICLAVDDLGAGYSNLKYIADLVPEVVKLDRELVAGVKHNSRLHRLLGSLVRLCTDMGARVVVEGIETKEEMRIAQDVGAQFGQGYFIARPAFPRPTFDWREINGH